MIELGVITTYAQAFHVSTAGGTEAAPNRHEDGISFGYEGLNNSGVTPITIARTLGICCVCAMADHNQGEGAVALWTIRGGRKLYVRIRHGNRNNSLIGRQASASRDCQYEYEQKRS